MSAVDSTALDNTIATANVNESLDVELINSFTGELSKLTDLIGIFQPTVVAAGTALYSYEVTGTLDATEVAEGAEVPLSQYTVEKTPVGAIEMNKYRKLTTAEAIQQGGYENAVLKTDAPKDGQAFQPIYVEGLSSGGGGTISVITAASE